VRRTGTPRLIASSSPSIMMSSRLASSRLAARDTTTSGAISRTASKLVCASDPADHAYSPRVSSGLMIISVVPSESKTSVIAMPARMSRTVR
jgi:hypothetical protein